MSINKFRIYRQEGKQIIERLIFPRFIAEITFNSPVSDIENVKMIDTCTDVMMVAKAMREAGEYIYNFKP